MTRPILAIALFLAVALIHLVTAGSQFDVERGELRELSSEIEGLKLRLIRDLRNKGKNKSHKGKKKSGQRKEKGGQRKKKSVYRKKKVVRRKKKSGQRKRGLRQRKRKFRQRKNKSVQRRGKAGMAKGDIRQACDVQALCQKIKEFIKVSNQLRKVKRSIKICALLENKAKKSATEFDATITSLNSVLVASRLPYVSSWLPRENQGIIENTTSIRDKLVKCKTTIAAICKKASVEACQKATLLTKCETELKDWANKFGPAKGSCLQSSDDCCACINAMKNVSSECLGFDQMSDNAVKSRTKCTSRTQEGSFGDCRKVQQQAVVYGISAAKVDCGTTNATANATATTNATANANANATATATATETATATTPTTTSVTTTTTTSVTTTTTTSVTTTTMPDLTINVTALEASVGDILDKIGKLTAKVGAITTKVDANAAKVDANIAKVNASTVKLDANTVKLDANTVKLDANTVKLDNNTVKLDANTVKLDANTVKLDANTAAITKKCNATTCKAIQGSVTKHETCFGDVSSTNCSSSKMGIAANIIANTANVAKAESCLADISSTDCPTVPKGKGIKAAITALEEPHVFNCYLDKDVEGDKDITDLFKCDVNVGNVFKALKFTVVKPGKYRLTFMALCKTEAFKFVTATLVKNAGTKPEEIAKSVAKFGGAEEVTTTIDIVWGLAKGDKVSVKISGGGSVISSALSRQVVFTGEYIGS